MEAAEEPINQRLKCLKEDRISALPNSIIQHILSLLQTKDAIKTGVLSKRWKYLWTSVPNLVFVCPEKGVNLKGVKCFQDIVQQHVEHAHDFIRFMDKTLILYSSEKVKKFSLSFKYYDFTENLSTQTVDSSVALWLRFATVRKVEELHLELCFGKDLNLSPFAYYPRYLLPLFLYENSSLTKLYSRFCDYKTQGHVSWPSVKALTISDAEFNEGILQRMLLGSPLLEYLELRNCLHIDKIDTSSNTRLKTLVMTRVIGDKGVLEISAPSVSSLEISGRWCPTTMFQLSNVSSLLIDATIDLELDFELASYNDIMPSPHECQEMLRQLLDKVNHAKNLTVGSSFVQVLSLLELKALSSPLSNHNSKCLTIATGFGRCDLLGVASLLNSFPCLEKLVIRFNDFNDIDLFDDDDRFKLMDMGDKNFWAAKERSFECLLMRLKTVEIVSAKPHLNLINLDSLFEFAKFILGSGRVLERMVLVPDKCSNSEMRDLYGVAQKLLSFPRSSPYAVVLLPKW